MLAIVSALEPWRHIQYRCTASFRAIATFAILRPRRMARWKNLLRDSAWLRTVTCAASTSKKPQQHIALLADVTESTTISAGLFRRNQSYITGNLLAAAENVRAFRSPTRKPGQ